MLHCRWFIVCHGNNIFKTLGGLSSCLLVSSCRFVFVCPFIHCNVRLSTHCCVYSSAGSVAASLLWNFLFLLCVAAASLLVRTADFACNSMKTTKFSFFFSFSLYHFILFYLVFMSLKLTFHLLCKKKTAKQNFVFCSHSGRSYMPRSHISVASFCWTTFGLCERYVLFLPGSNGFWKVFAENAKILFVLCSSPFGSFKLRWDMWLTKSRVYSATKKKK